MFIDGHLQVQAGELTEMTVRVGILGAENWANFKDAIKAAARDSHQLIELRRLGQTSRLVEIF